MNFCKNVLLFSVLFFTGVANAKPTRYFIRGGDVKPEKFGITTHHLFKHGFSAELTPDQVQKFERRGLSVEPVALYQFTGKPVCGDGKCQGNEPMSCPQDCGQEPPPDDSGRVCEPPTQIPWGISTVNGGSGGDGVTVAVLDTGANTSHPDLNISLCKDTTKRGIKNGCQDDVGHGTHVAGTIAANGGADGKGIFGVAPKAILQIIKVCRVNGCYVDDVATGIIYSANQGANIISMSLGGDTESSLIRDAIDYADAKGVLIIAAAGNDGPEIGTIDYPAANPKVVAVGAIDEVWNVASFSSRGINDGDLVVEEREVELAAPGVDVLSTYKDGCYAYMSGTSMATPHVAGLSAKLWQGDATSTRSYLHFTAVVVDFLDSPSAGFGLPIAP